MTKNFKYQEYPAPDYLSAYIKSFWTFEQTIKKHSELKFSPIPDGFPGMIFQLSDKPIFHDTELNNMPTIFVFRPTMIRKQMILSGEIATLGIYFYPSAIKTIFGFDVNTITEDCLGYDLISQKDYQNILIAITSLPNHRQRIDYLSKYFYKKIETNQSNSQKVDFAVQKILQSDGQIHLQELLNTLNISERSLERYFKEFIGINPNKYIRLCRFNASLQNIKTLNYEKLTEIAYDLGYADQSHFIREFKKFSGISPLKFLNGEKDILNDLQIFSGKTD